MAKNDLTERLRAMANNSGRGDQNLLPWQRTLVYEAATAIDTTEFTAEAYLREHGGSWGVCRWQNKARLADAVIAAACELNYVTYSNQVRDERAKAFEDALAAYEKEES